MANFSFYAQTNLVSNGDFENWSSSSQPNGWGRFFSGLIYQDTDSQNGNSSTKIELTNGSLNYMFTSVYFPVEAGKTYKVSGYHKLVAGTITSVELGLIDSDVWQTPITSSIDNITSNSQWRKIEYDYVATTTKNIGVIIWARGTSTPIPEILVDNISVTEVVQTGSQYTSIPDINFENKLIELGIDSGTADGQVLTSSIASVTSLNIERSSISDLTGIENFTSLEILSASRNSITNVNLSKNINLAYLYLDNNQLTAIDLSANTALKRLDCQKNKLSSLDISNNINLTSLNCSSNVLTGLNIDTNTLLTSLVVNSNKLPFLNVDNNLALQGINCGGNLLTVLNVDKNLALTHLWCGSNKLTSLNINKNLELDDLNCGINELKTLNVSDNKKLLYLVCHQNKINSLDVSENILLQQLMCHYNELTTIDVSHNPELYMLNCHFNKITDLDISTNSKITEITCNDNDLKLLNLKNGNNNNFELFYTTFINNPNLTCIRVDDVTYSDTKWASKKDATATYSSTCTLGIEDSVFSTAALYPNPTKGEININNVALDKATVYNSLGQLVKSFTLNSANTDNTINLSGLPKGIYYVYLINGDAASAKKIIVE